MTETPNPAESISADVLEFEAATKKALKAMRSGDRQVMAVAFERYSTIYVRMAEKPYDDVAADARCIESRGRIDLDDWKRILAAMNALNDEFEREANGPRSQSDAPIV